MSAVRLRDADLKDSPQGYTLKSMDRYWLLLTVEVRQCFFLHDSPGGHVWLDAWDDDLLLMSYQGARIRQRSLFPGTQLVNMADWVRFQLASYYADPEKIAHHSNSIPALRLVAHDAKA